MTNQELIGLIKAEVRNREELRGENLIDLLKDQKGVEGKISAKVTKEAIGEVFNTFERCLTGGGVKSGKCSAEGSEFCQQLCRKDLIGSARQMIRLLIEHED